MRTAFLPKFSLQWIGDAEDPLRQPHWRLDLRWRDLAKWRDEEVVEEYGQAVIFTDLARDAKADHPMFLKGYSVLLTALLDWEQQPEQVPA